MVKKRRAYFKSFKVEDSKVTILTSFTFNKGQWLGQTIHPVLPGTGETIRQGGVDNYIKRFKKRLSSRVG